MALLTDASRGGARSSCLGAYVVAAVAVVVAIAVRHALSPLIGNQFPYATAYFAVVFAAWWGGVGPGLFALGVDGVAAIYFFVPESQLFKLRTTADWVGLILYTLNGLWVVALSEQLRRACRHTERIHAQALRHQDDHRLLKEASHETEERYRLMIEAVRDYALFMLDPIGRVMSWNPGAQRLFGYTESEILGQHFSVLYIPDDVRAGRPMATLERATANGRTQEDHWMVRKCGDRFWASGVSAPLSTGNARGYAKVVRDLSAQKRAEQELQTSEQRYRNFVAQSSEGIWRIEFDPPIPVGLPEGRQIDLAYERGYLAECNDAMARMHNFASAAQLIGARLGDLLAPADAANVEYLRAFVRSGYRLNDAKSYDVDADGRQGTFLNSLVGIVQDDLLTRAWGTQRSVSHQPVAELVGSA